jgi:hypothetical protein
MSASFDRPNREDRNLGYRFRSNSSISPLRRIRENLVRSTDLRDLLQVLNALRGTELGVWLNK